MKKEKQFACFLLALIMLLCAALPGIAAEAEEKPPAQTPIERLVITYAARGQRDGQALEALAALDPAAGDQWSRILDLWEAPVAVGAVLPDGLSRDDTLCLVALGFQLNPDGTMREELVERLQVLKAASEQYPNAVIVCTGGGTAAADPTATEAGRMAEMKSKEFQREIQSEIKEKSKGNPKEVQR